MLSIFYIINALNPKRWKSDGTKFVYVELRIMYNLMFLLDHILRCITDLVSFITTDAHPDHNAVKRCVLEIIITKTNARKVWTMICFVFNYKCTHLVFGIVLKYILYERWCFIRQNSLRSVSPQQRSKQSFLPS